MLKVFIVIFWAAGLAAQDRIGELRLTVTDPTDAGLKSAVELVSKANGYHNTFTTDDDGKLDAKRLPFGTYEIAVRSNGFAPALKAVQVRSAVPMRLTLRLGLSPVNTTVTVDDSGALVDSSATGVVNRVSTEAIEARPTSMPGRSLVDLVNSQPGWLYEGNAVLHPRGSEYQTQFVVNGIPLTDNRSLGFAPGIEADDVQSISIHTANIPAEYGRKMGGVVEVNTQKDSRQGLHGELVGSGGSFAMAQGYGSVQYARGKNTFAISFDGTTTDRYLNPPAAQNYTNVATTNNYGAQYEHDFNKDHLAFIFGTDQARYLVPNEQVQEAAGQRQDRANFETMGIISFQHVISLNALADFRGMVRDDTSTLASNALSMPIIAAQDRGFREEYGKGTISIHHGRHEWKTGVEADFTSVHEMFQYTITDPSLFDPQTPARFSFLGRGIDREQSAFVQDLVSLGNWTINAGLRWDHYQFLVKQNALSPRIGVGRYFPDRSLLLYASFDRVFQTPAFENLLLSSSPQVLALNDNVLRLPVRPSLGNYAEVGVVKALDKSIRLNVNYFRRNFSNFADDDLLLNTGISFPIAFRAAQIYGAEAKFDLLQWGPLSGFLSYSYLVGSASLPIVGGLFLGYDATNALNTTSGRFWITQDQRHTLRARFHCRVASRLWLGGGASFGSGLPTEFTGTVQQAIAQYGTQLVNQVDLQRGRLRPSYSVDFSSAIELHNTDKLTMKLQADVENLTNHFNLIDFAGLFSGTAVAPPRSAAIRCIWKF
jgi:outer membrane cobalamin receptor